MKNQKNTSIRETVLKMLQSLSEKDLTLNIIVPLLKAIGYEKIEYHGGPYEIGKDIICWGIDEIGLTKLTVVQVKKYKIESSSSAKNSFAGVVNQLQQAAEERIQNINGNMYLPSTIYFITPYQVDTRALSTRFAEYRNLRSTVVKTIDGELLVTLIYEKCSYLINDIIGEKIAFDDKILETLNNNDLLAALNYKENIDVSYCYCDLSFVLGKENLMLLYSNRFKPKSIKFLVTESEWIQLLDLDNSAKKYFDAPIIASSIEKTIVEFSGKNFEYQSKKDEFAKYFGIVRQILTNKTFPINKQSVDRLSTKLFPYIDKLITWHNNRIAERENNVIGDDLDLLRMKLSLVKEEKIEIKTLFEEYLNNKLSISDIQRLCDLVNKYLAESLAIFPVPLCSVELDCCRMVKKIKAKRSWLNNKTKEISNIPPSTKNLRLFLLKCKQLFYEVGKIFLNPFVLEAAGVPTGIVWHNVEELPRLTFSVHDVFKTGLNIFLLGEAGAGKTTSVQEYARQSIDEADESKLVIFLPLSKIIYTGNKDIRSLSNKTNTIDCLVSCIISYFKSLNYNILPVDFIAILKKKQVCLLFDGLDEVVSKAPWVPESIINISSKYPNIQCIVSSRISTKYEIKVPFISITLLPFTTEQREFFIEKWFELKDTTKPLIIKDHLSRHSDLETIIRNPLLSTIFCVLAEHEIPLPINEVRIYDERLNLLFGVYDSHKKSLRNLSDKHDLENIACKVALLFHKKSIRYLSKDNIVRAIADYSKGKTDISKIEITVNELIDPCNILMPMTLDGQLGFGHLRYQEHLVAKEIYKDRNIDIVPLMSDSWWRGALVLFSLYFDNLETIISPIISDGMPDSMKETICALLYNRNGQDAINIRNQMNWYI